MKRLNSQASIDNTSVWFDPFSFYVSLLCLLFEFNSSHSSKLICELNRCIADVSRFTIISTFRFLFSFRAHFIVTSFLKNSGRQLFAKALNCVCFHARCFTHTKLHSSDTFYTQDFSWPKLLRASRVLTQTVNFRMIPLREQELTARTASANPHLCAPPSRTPKDSRSV